jgi:hypothetical protein
LDGRFDRKITFFHFNAFIFFRQHRRNQELAPVFQSAMGGLKVGCQRIIEPVSYLFFINLRSTACGNDVANFLILFSIQKEINCFFLKIQ